MMEHNSSNRETDRKGGSNGQTSFASLTAGLMARKGEAVPAPAHLDGVSIHSHGVAREPLAENERDLGQAPPPQEIEPQPQQRAEPPRSGLFSGSRGQNAPLGSFRDQVRQALKPTPPAPEEQEPKPVMSEAELRRRAARRATVITGDCCALPLPRAVTEPLPEGHKSTVTTRLDPERVRKLKILAARMGTTNQKVMLAALDYYIDYACDVLASECPCLARSMAEGE